MFEKRFHPKIKSDLKKIDKKIVENIKNIHIQNIAKEPYKYPSLKGNLSKFRSYHFREKRTDYRIAYKIVNNEVVVYLIIAKRENFYKNFLKRI